MALLDPKERVIEIALTQEGRKQLAKGRFLPRYFAFSDDEVNYQVDNFSQLSTSTQVVAVPIEGLELDLWAADGVVISGSDIVTWTDRVKGIEFGQANIIKRPMLSSWRGREGITFQGTAVDLTSSVPGGFVVEGSPYTFYYVGSLGSLAGTIDNSVMDFISGSDRTWFIFETSPSFELGIFDGGSWRDVNAFASTGDHVWEWDFPDGHLTASQDGVELGTAPIITTRPLGGKMVIGAANAESAQFLTGTIGRILIYSGSHDKEGVYNWASDYYGL